MISFYELQEKSNKENDKNKIKIYLDFLIKKYGEDADYVNVDFDNKDYETQLDAVEVYIEDMEKKEEKEDEMIKNGYNPEFISYEDYERIEGDIEENERQMNWASDRGC